MKGCIHIYCGDGKGKTSAALGLALRASGRGKKVLVVRFLKTDDSGEVEPSVLCQECRQNRGRRRQHTISSSLRQHAGWQPRAAKMC